MRPGKPPMPLTRDALRERVRVTESGCWEWTGKRQRRANGQLTYGVAGSTRHRKGVPAHRLSYELFIGPIPDGLMILHACDNPPCINPEHLRAGTQQENGRDMAERKRAHFAGVTHCVNGHPFDGTNTYFSTERNGTVRRGCRVCRAEADRRYKARCKSA